MSKKDLNAVIFSGGGADGAYQLGVARALFNGKCPSTFGESLAPEAFAGTSIGSFNASYLVSHWQEFGSAAVAKLEKVWLERIAWHGAVNGGFRVRLNPLDLFDPMGYLKEPLRFRPLTNFFNDAALLTWEGVSRTYNLLREDEPLLKRATDFFNLSSFLAPKPWEDTIRESIDFKKIRDSDRKLRIAATNWAFGEVREFKNEHMTDRMGPAAIRASSAVPGVYPPAQVGAQTYVDGAVLMNTPLKPAILSLVDVLKDRQSSGESDEDPELVLHMIYMNTDVEKMPVEALQSTLQTLYRTQVIGWAAAVNRDIERAKNLNEGLEMIRKADDPTQESGLQGDNLRVLLESAKALKKALERGRRYKLLTIHRYFPPDGLDGALGFLDLRRKRMERLIDHGFQDTVSHNCVANGCVLAGRYRGLAED